MDFEECKHGSLISSDDLKNLHHNQGGTGRHRCPTCAFQLGYNVGSNGKYNDYKSFLANTEGDTEECPEGTVVPTDYLLIAGDNQGGYGRHKCCNCAFKLGFERAVETNNGLLQINISSLNLENKPKVKNVKDVDTNDKVYKGFDYEGNYNQKKLIGDIGESLVLGYERNLDYNKNNQDRIRNIAKEVGDGAGYDILSFDENGNPKYIEVKTTLGDKKSPFFISINEKNFLFNNDNTFIYRVFDLSIERKEASFFILTKDDIVNLKYKPQVFKVIFE